MKKYIFLTIFGVLLILASCIGKSSNHIKETYIDERCHIQQKRLYTKNGFDYGLIIYEDSTKLKRYTIFVNYETKSCVLLDTEDMVQQISFDIPLYYKKY